jgi:hypothetical protein
MTKDNSTGKNKEFYDLGKKMFDRINPLGHTTSRWSGKVDRTTPPEQEPVAWMFQHEETGRTMCVDAQQVEWGFEKGNPRFQKIGPLYTAPPKRQPLTDKDILADETLRYYFGQNGGAGPVSKQGRRVVDAIEAAHGIKE